MKDLQSTEFKDQVQISVIAWIVIIVSGTILYFTTFSIVKVKMIMDSSLFKNFQSDFIDHSNAEGIDVINNMMRMQEGILTYYFILFIFSLIGLIAGIGILKRRALGKLILTILSICFVLGIIGGVIFIRLSLTGYYSNFISQMDARILQNINKIQKVNLIGLALFFIVVARSLLRAVLKLNSKAFRIYFE